MIVTWLKCSLLLLLVSGACTNNTTKKQPTALSVMHQTKTDKTHQKIHALAISKLDLWLSKNLEEVQVLKECNWRLDSMVVLNSTKDRAILLLDIQDKQQQAELDYVYIMYAAKNNLHWQIFFAGLPNIVYERARYAAGKPITLQKLAELSRAHIIASYFNKDGKVIDKRVNKFYTADLTAKNKKFL